MMKDIIAEDEDEEFKNVAHIITPYLKKLPSNKGITKNMIESSIRKAVKKIRSSDDEHPVRLGVDNEPETVFRKNIVKIRTQKLGTHAT